MSVSRDWVASAGVVVGIAGALFLGTALASATFSVSDAEAFSSRMTFMIVCAIVGLVLLGGGAAMMGRSRLRDARTWLDRDPGIPLWADPDTRAGRSTWQEASSEGSLGGEEVHGGGGSGPGRNGRPLLAERSR